MLIKKKYKVVIIGSGPAGSSAARVLACNGIEALSIERKRVIGLPAQCGGLVSLFHYARLKPVRNSFAFKADNMIFSFSDKEKYTFNWPGIIIDRHKLDSELLEESRTYGADIMLAANVFDVHGNKISFINKDGIHTIEADIVIFADGPRSLFDKIKRSCKKLFIYCIQSVNRLITPVKDVILFFDQVLEGGYGWIIPKGMKANIGIGVTNNNWKEVNRLFDNFTKRLTHLNIIDIRKMCSKIFALVPVCSEWQTPIINNYLAIGDAAGLSHPISGAGIGSAILSGEICGNIVAQAIKKKDLAVLQGYNDELTINLPLGSAIKRREIMDKNWHTGSFKETIFKSWMI